VGGVGVGGIHGLGQLQAVILYGAGLGADQFYAFEPDYTEFILRRRGKAAAPFTRCAGRPIKNRRPFRGRRFKTVKGF